MSKEQSSDQTQNRKELFKSDLKQGLEGLKEIFVATLTLIIDLTEAIPRSIKSSSLRPIKNKTSNKEDDSALSFVRDNSNSREESQAVDVSVEVTENWIDHYSLLFTIRILYPLLAVISTTSLVIGVQKIQPLTQWAETQNECIAKTRNEEGIAEADLTTKVMKCNGGHSI